MQTTQRQWRGFSEFCWSGSAILAKYGLVNWANSTGAYRHLLYTSVLGASMKLVGNTLLVQKYGLNGIAAATALRYLITTGYLVLIRTQRASLTLK